eukprot:gene20250-22233_t
MTTSRNGLVCGMRRQQELQWTEINGELLCHSTLKDLEHGEEEEVTLLESIIKNEDGLSWDAMSF